MCYYITLTQAKLNFNLRKVNFTNTLCQLAYSQVLLQHLNSVHLHWVIQHHSKCWIVGGILHYGIRHSLQCVHLHWDIQLPQGSWGHSATLVVAGDIQPP